MHPAAPARARGRSPPRSGTEFSVLPGLTHDGSSSTITYAPDARSRLKAAELGSPRNPLEYVGTTPRPP